MHAQQPQAGGDLRLRAGGGIGVDVGFVDHHQIGQLHHAFFDGLQIITRVGQLHQHKHVGHALHRRLALAYAHGLHNHHVVARRLADQHGLAGFLGHTAQGAAGGAGADKRFVVHRQLFHPRLVAQDRAARHGGRRINSQNRDPVTLLNQI